MKFSPEARKHIFNKYYFNEDIHSSNYLQLDRLIASDEKKYSDY